MDFNFTEEQQLLRDSVRRFVRENYDFTQREKIVESDAGFSTDHWRLFAELGWLALPFAEADGGLDGTVIDTMIVMEELGRGLVVEPYLATVVVGGGFLRRAPDALRAAHVEGVIAGETHMAFAGQERQARFDLFDVATTAKKDGDAWVIDGRKELVLNGPAADLLVVPARTSGGRRERDGITLFLVDADAEGISRRDYRTQDAFRAADIEFAGVRVPAGNVIGAEGDGLSVIETVVDEAIVALGAEAVGMMEELRDKTVEYAKTRVQFGVPIGKFQVLQHRMVEMFMETEQTRSQLYRAAMTQAAGDAEASRAAAGLKAYLAKAGRYVGQEAIQIHGGMGMTWELDIGHYVKRLTMINLMFGTGEHHLARYAAA